MTAEDRHAVHDENHPVLLDGQCGARMEVQPGTSEKEGVMKIHRERTDVRSLGIMLVVNVIAIVNLIGAVETATARDNLPGTNEGACTCMCASNEKNPDGSPKYNNPQTAANATTPGACNGAVGGFCKVGTVNGYKEGKFVSCFWQSASGTPGRPPLQAPPSSGTTPPRAPIQPPTQR